MGLSVFGSGFRVSGSGFTIQGPDFKVYIGLGFGGAYFGREVLRWSLRFGFGLLDCGATPDKHLGVRRMVSGVLN